MAVFLVAPRQSVSPIRCVFILSLDVTNIDYMIYTRGSRDDYDRWADTTGDSGWGWEAMMPYMLKLENFSVSLQVGDASSKYNSSVHNTTGTFSTPTQVRSGETD